VWQILIVSVLYAYLRDLKKACLLPPRIVTLTALSSDPLIRNFPFCEKATLRTGAV
jgi:hypothetical protein